jgi:hypothetical protein
MFLQRFCQMLIALSISRETTPLFNPHLVKPAATECRIVEGGRMCMRADGESFNPGTSTIH